MKTEKMLILLAFECFEEALRWIKLFYAEQFGQILSSIASSDDRIEGILMITRCIEVIRSF